MTATRRRIALIVAGALVVAGCLLLHPAIGLVVAGVLLAALVIEVTP